MHGVFGFLRAEIRHPADDFACRRIVDRERWLADPFAADEAGGTQKIRIVESESHGQTALSASSPKVAKWKSGVVSCSTAMVPPKPLRPLRRSIQQVL